MSLDAPVNQSDPDTIVFDVTASTNVPGGKIVIRRKGGVEFALTREDEDFKVKSHTSFSVEQSLVDEIFASLSAVWPLQSSGRFAIKSASFGHYSYVTYMGTKSPDLESCLLDQKVKKLITELNTVFERARKFYMEL